MCKHIPHTPSIRALTASSCHGKFRAQCLGVPGATATLSREQEPCFCWLDGEEPRASSAELPHFSPEAHPGGAQALHSHGISRGNVHTQWGHGVTPTKIPGPDPLTQQFSTWNSAGHTLTCTRWPSMRLLTGNTQKSMVHLFTCTCACMYVFVCINVYMY